LVYSHEAILPCELKTGSRWLALQNQLTADDYKNLMIDESEELVGCWLTRKKLLGLMTKTLSLRLFKKKI
jgi:hypothetical protein